MFDQKLENFKALENLFNTTNTINNNNNDDDSNEGKEKTMNMNNNMNYNIFNLENDWDEIPNAGTNNKSIFKESLQSNDGGEVANWESTIIDYINDVDKGNGYVTLDKMRDDLDYIYDIQLAESDVRDWCKSHQNICHLFTLGGIEVVLTKTAPSFDIIAKDLGLTEGVDYDNTIIEEEIQPDQKYPVKSPISESTQELTEKTWEYKMPVDVVRDLADASDVGDLNGMSDGLIKCYKWISENVSDFYSDIDFEADEEYLSGLKVEYFEDEDELEEEIDGAINAFYDLCDAFNIWVPNYADIAIEEEDIDESLTDDQKYPIKSPIVEDINTEYYGVFRSGGSIGDFNNYANHHGTLIAVYDKEHIEDAHIKAKHRRKMLSRGEKDYYKISYIVKPLTQNDLKNDYVKSLISNNLNESFKNHSNKIEEKWNIGSDKSNLTTEEMNKLKDLAKMLQDNSPNNWKYTVEKTYEDFGAGMQWYTIICYDRRGNSWQVLNTKEWLDLMNSDNIKAIYDVVVNGRYFQDKAQKGKIDLWKWGI